MWPQVPEAINSLSADAARGLVKAIKTLAVSKLRSGVTGDERKEVDAYLAKADALSAWAIDADAAAALEADNASADADEAAAAATAEAAATAAAAAALEAEQAVADEVAAAAAAAEATAAAEAATAAEEALAGKPGKLVPTTFGTPAVPPATGTPSVKRTAPEYLFATSGVQGKNPGDNFASWSEVADAAADRAKSLNPSTSERFEIARIRGNYAPEQILGDDVMLNLAKFDDAEMTATLCAPATPHYDLACANVLDRPVFNSLPGFQAPRGKVSIMSSPSLSSITTGYGQWTAADDANANAVKDACQTIECGSPTEYTMYGVYRCLTVKNMLAMTYPELVEAYLNRLGAAHARLAEELLLNAMATGCDTLAAPRLGYGASVTITSTILNYLALYQESERWSINGNMQAWLPRHVQWGMKMDILRRRRVDGGFSIPSDAQINGMFNDVGVTPHWFMDTPTYAVAVPGPGTSTLNRIPASVQVMIAPPGKFAAIDRGELAIGVTGNNIYRDNESNRRNQFTFFFENFEGVVDTTSCPAHILDIPVCWNGAQIDDIVINCQGGDEVGYQS